MANHQPLAYEPDGRIAVVVDLPSHRYRGEQRAAFHEQLRAAMASLSAIRSAHLAHTVPPVYALNSPELRIDGIAVDTTRLPPYFTANFVDPGYFDALGIRLLCGRAMVEAREERPPAHAPTPRSLFAASAERLRAVSGERVTRDSLSLPRARISPIPPSAGSTCAFTHAATSDERPGMSEYSVTAALAGIDSTTSLRP